jgi:hypothetical protein
VVAVVVTALVELGLMALEVVLTTLVVAHSAIRKRQKLVGLEYCMLGAHLNE